MAAELQKKQPTTNKQTNKTSRQDGALHEAHDDSVVFVRQLSISIIKIKKEKIYMWPHININYQNK